MKHLLPLLLVCGVVFANTRAVPDGFRIIGRSGPIGQALFGTFQTTGGARTTLRGVVQLAGPYFDHPPSLTGAISDERDQQVQAFFRSTYNGVPVRGIVLLNTAGGRGSVGVVFDREDLFNRSLPALSRQLLGGLPAGGGGQRQPLRQTPLTDGSGTIGLPPGWRIVGAFKGTVDVVGPSGEQASFGGYQQVFVNPLPGYPANHMRGPYRPPAAALYSYLDTLTQGSFSRRQASFRVLEQAPVQAQQGQAAYISYEVQAQGKVARGLAMVNTAPIDQTNWFFYLSCVAAPAEHYERELPAMWAMWKSWSVNPAVFRERMDAAIQSMRDTFKIIQSVSENQSRTFDHVNKAWDQVIRGVTTVEYTPTGGRADVDTRYVDDVVRSLNENGEQWRKVPLQELTR